MHVLEICVQLGASAGNSRTKNTCLSNKMKNNSL